MNINGKSDIGMVRKENQDAFWFSTEEDCCFAAVCDGMGGAQGGGKASTIAVETARGIWRQNPGQSPKELFDRVTAECNRAVYRAAQADPALYGMGTTMVLARAQKDKVYICNIGDSRAYLITGGSVRQITKDHSAVQQLVDSGHITERQARIHPNKNVITRAIGVEKDVQYDLFCEQIASGNILVLCTDGLTNFVDENEIQFEAFGGAFDDLPQRLIDLANSRGGSDNITVVTIRF